MNCGEAEEMCDATYVYQQRCESNYEIEGRRQTAYRHKEIWRKKPKNTQSERYGSAPEHRILH